MDEVAIMERWRIRDREELARYPRWLLADMRLIMRAEQHVKTRKQG